MSEALEKIDRGALAALMSPEEIESFNADFSAGVGSDFLPTLSIRGGKFRLKIDGAEEVVGQELFVNLVGSRPCTSKTFYLNGYDPKSDQKAPDCSSVDSQYPDSNIQNPVSPTCQLCDNNAWGSKGEGSKGKACSDYKQIVVAINGIPDTAFGLRIPPTSFKPFASYISKLKMGEVPANAAVTKLTLGDEEYPTLQFDYTGLVDRATFDILKQTAASVEVQNVIQIQPRAEAPKAAPAPEAKTAEQPVAVETPVVPDPAPAPDTSSTALKDLLEKNKVEKKSRKKKSVDEVIEESTAAPVQEAEKVVEEPVAQTDGAAKLNALLAKMKG